MTEQQPRYLPCYDEKGVRLPRLDLLIFSALRSSDVQEIKASWAHMKQEEDLAAASASGGLSGPAKAMLDGWLSNQITQRVYAGEVVLELARLAQSGKAEPSLNAARRLVAHNSHQSFQRSSPTSILREVEKSFRVFRSTAHLQATMVHSPESLRHIENNFVGVKAFLATAKAFEQLIDTLAANGNFHWDPLKVPPEFLARDIPRLPPLTDEELNIAQHP